MDKSLEELPTSQIPIDIYFVDYISLYYALGEVEKGNLLLRELAEDNCQMLRYIHSLSPKFINSVRREENISLYILQRLFEMAQESGQDELCTELKNKIESIYNQTIFAQPTQKETKDSTKVQ